MIAAALARAGGDVVVLMRSSTIERYAGRLVVESAVLGDFEVDVPATTKLDRDIDALWVAVKATELEAACALAPPECVSGATVVPLLNGVDHVGLLRARYAHVVAATIRVESERSELGRIRQLSPFLRVELAGGEALVPELRAAGIDAEVRPDERTVLWGKLAFLAPLSLATTALDAPLGGVRGDDRYQRCQEEVLAIAHAEGAEIDADALRAVAASAPDGLRSSMQKDVGAGRTPELDAIATPILRGGHRYGITTTATSELVELVKARLALS